MPIILTITIIIIGYNCTNYNLRKRLELSETTLARGMLVVEFNVVCLRMVGESIVESPNSSCISVATEPCTAATAPSSAGAQGAPPAAFPMIYRMS